MELNWIAVLLAAVASFAVGALWYGPLFGRYWMGLMGYTPDSMRSMKMTPARAMTIGFVAQVVMATALAYLIAETGSAEIGEAIEVALWVWLGFLATKSLGVYLWEGKSFRLFAFNAIHDLLAILAMAVVLGLLG